ncbi:hypothetical protein [Thermogutta sp.]|uniref:hypothetical protein n=1 Tax=Thermogutta sp. TaxID=1962930 RepID=UPI0032202797
MLLKAPGNIMPVTGILFLFTAPILFLLSRIGAEAAIALAVCAIILGVLLTRGEPPAYEIVLMAVTAILPIGMPFINAYLDGYCLEAGLGKIPADLKMKWWREEG